MFFKYKKWDLQNFTNISVIDELCWQCVKIFFLLRTLPHSCKHLRFWKFFCKTVKHSSSVSKDVTKLDLFRQRLYDWLSSFVTYWSFALLSVRIYIGSITYHLVKALPISNHFGTSMITKLTKDEFKDEIRLLLYYLTTRWCRL